MEKDVNEAFKLYGEQLIDLLEFQINKITHKDLSILQRILPNEFSNKFVLNNLNDKIIQFFQSIRNYSTKPNTMNCFVKAGDKENHLIVDVDFLYDKYYFFPINFPYLIRKNYFSLKRVWNIKTDYSEDNSSRIKENNLFYGFDYNYAKSKKSFLLSNTTYFKPEYNIELDCLVKMSTSPKDVKRTQTSSVGKIILRKNFEEKSFIFRDINEIENINRINFEIGHKIISNKIDQYNCSPDIIANVPEQDSSQYLKISYEKFLFNDFRKSMYFNASSSLINTINSLYLKHKLFMRKFFDFSSILVQLNVELGLINSLSDRDVRLHDKFSLNNFKGIQSPSKKISVLENHTGDSLGLKSYFQLNKKILFTNLPFFKSFTFENDRFQISPFTHFNFLFTPDLLQEKGRLKPYYLSSGFGLTFFCEYVAFEVYYNAYIKKNEKDISFDFSFNFGMD